MFPFWTSGILFLLVGVWGALAGHGVIGAKPVADEKVEARRRRQRRLLRIYGPAMIVLGVVQIGVALLIGARQ
jgi:hypothetical protein